MVEVEHDEPRVAAVNTRRAAQQLADVDQVATLARRQKRIRFQPATLDTPGLAALRCS
jgi:hypothetical protein